jgi:hypothetical protein
MLELLKRLKRDAKITEGVGRLAAKEREVRSLELLIGYISSLEDRDLARVWPRLIRAIYASPAPNQPTRTPPSDDNSPTVGAR